MNPAIVGLPRSYPKRQTLCRNTKKLKKKEETKWN